MSAVHWMVCEGGVSTLCWSVILLSVMLHCMLYLVQGNMSRFSS